ncbi:MAG: HEAT repeat domain-containing protein [Planctomycetota bacterium]
MSAVFLLASTSAAWAHGGQMTPPPPPPPTPDWMKPDPYAPPPPPSLPTGPLKPPTTPRPGFTPPTTRPDPTRPGPTTPGFDPNGPRPGVPTTPTPPAPPTPTPPAPPSQPVTPSGPAAPKPAGPDTDGTPGSKPTVNGRRDRSGEGRRTATVGVDWTLWWDQNADRFRAARRGGVVTGDADALGRVLAQARRLEVVPFLRAAAGGAHGDDADVLASSFIALGKTTDEPSDADRLLAVLRDAGAPTLAREGAAVALGCLRRDAEADRFDGRFLDRVRRGLLDAFDDDGVPVRVRCFAAFSLGLLGDQPGTPGDAFARDLRGTTQALWSRLLEPRTGPEATVALLSALSMQPEDGVPSGVREALRALAGTGRLAGRDRGDVAQAHAVVAYAKLVGPEAAGFLLGLAKGSHHPSDVRRSAILSLGVLAPRLDGATRGTAVAELLAPARRGDPETAGFALLSIGRLVAASLASAPSELPRGADALADATDHGSSATRPFAALALGLALRSDGEAAACGGLEQLRARALPVLAAVVDRETEDPACRAAAALALGLAGDRASATRLGRLVLDADTAPDVRARAACALGLLDRASPETLAALRAALVRRSSDDLRREASRALGALGDADATDALVDEIRLASADHVRARAAVALGAIGATKAVRPLLSLAADRKVGDPARAVAVAALGLLADPASVPSLSRLSLDVNYLAGTDALNEVLSLL